MKKPILPIKNSSLFLKKKSFNKASNYKMFEVQNKLIPTHFVG